MYAYFISRLQMAEYRRGWLKGDCPFCGRDKKYGVNISSNRTNCFVCGHHPRPINAIMELEKFKTYNEVWRFLKAFEGIQYADYLTPGVIPQSHIELPEGFQLLTEGDDYLARLVRHTVRHKRHLRVKYLAKKGYGYCTTGKYFGYLIMPFQKKGELVYFHARKIVGTGPKFDNPTIEEAGIGKSLLLYNWDSLYLYEHIYLVESVINAETIGEEGVATGGKAISKWQLAEIIKSPVKRVTILLDPDALEYAYKNALKLVRYKKVRVIHLPKEEDVNSIGKKKTMEFVKSTSFMEYSELLKNKHEYARPRYTLE